MIYDFLEKVVNVLEKPMINNNEELMNNALKTINTLATIISLKEQSRITKRPNKVNTIDNPIKQSNTINTPIKQSNIINTPIK